MSDMTVKQLAELVGIPSAQLLEKMQKAGLEHASESATISASEKQILLSFLQGDGATEPAKDRLVLKRTKVSTLKASHGKRKTISIVRKQKKYVKPTEEAEDTSSSSSASQVELKASHEMQRIRDEEAARKTAAHEAKVSKQQQQEAAEAAAIAKKVEKEAEAAEKEAVKEQKEKEEANTSAKESVKSSKPSSKATEAGSKDAANQQRSKPATPISATSDKKFSDQDDEFGDGKSRRRRKVTLKPSSSPSSRSKGAAAQAAGKGFAKSGGFEQPVNFTSRQIDIPESITVVDLAHELSVKSSEVIKVLMQLGVMATLNQHLDQDSAALVVEEIGHIPNLIQDDDLELELQRSHEVDGVKEIRPPVVTVMGHVDHGKTSLLDYIRRTKLTAKEAGGITQHIGAYHVDVPGGSITFLDTPGHAAFTAMRARGSKLTDIVILVVAADDGIMPQTEEAITHAKNADVPIIVAINKIDKPDVNVERIISELASKDVLAESWGGDTQCIEVSALTGQGIDELLEAISLQAELLSLKAVYEAPAIGVVAESKLDKNRGSVATVLVQNGTLKQGDIVVVGDIYGRIRVICDDCNNLVGSASPSMPVEVLGLNGVPDVGETFFVVPNEKQARKVVKKRAKKQVKKPISLLQQKNNFMDDAFSTLAEVKSLRVILKADTKGSLGAILQAVEELGTDEVGVDVLLSGVGGFSESDVTFSSDADVMLIGFNTRADVNAKKVLERNKLVIRYYSVIYELLDDIKLAMAGLLGPELREHILGIAEVKDTFTSPKYGQIAGCLVVEGTIHKSKPIRVLRDDVVVFEGELESLKHFKEDVSDVRSGTECGIGVQDYKDVQIGDRIEVFDVQEIPRVL